ncbi:restriction endonuclease subunit S [Chryseobacterium mulctrae]|uniref:restriction endonuclease subunit S n=1 Tax=Chryseobacterium mulctrae TaxID=2576777 RepID=UPI00111773BE|nr:restriction endonuclease subunit S [Chryseobacterium mulctrae]
MQRYEKYKDSGVDWIGEIPHGWFQKPFSSVFSLKSIINNKNEELLSVYLDKGVIRFSDVGEKRTNVTSEDLSKYQLVEEGDFVLNNQQAWRGSVGVSFYRGIVSPAYIVLAVKNNFDFRFLNYLLRNRSFVTHYLLCSKGVGTIQRNLYWPQLKRVYLIFPSLEEQQTIATFLDDKTSKIDQTISNKQKEIELLKERRQILIQKAVTKGLDDTVPLKDSGVDWIGEIPEHWEVRKLRYLGQTQNGISKGGDFFGTGNPFLSYGDVYKNSQVPSNISGLVESTNEEIKQYSVKKGDVFFTRTSETKDDIGVSSVCYQDILNATFAGFLIRFRPFKNRLDKGFSKFYFRTNLVSSFFTTQMNIVTRASLSQELLKSLSVILPPIEEQFKIGSHLEELDEKIAKAILLKKQEIEKLKEYKTVLIDNVVTGKVKIN